MSDAGTVVLDEHVGLVDQRQNVFETCWVLQVDLEELLVAVLNTERQAKLLRI